MQEIPGSDLLPLLFWTFRLLLLWTQNNNIQHHQAYYGTSDPPHDRPCISRNPEGFHTTVNKPRHSHLYQPEFWNVSEVIFHLAGWSSIWSSRLWALFLHQPLAPAFLQISRSSALFLLLLSKAIWLSLAFRKFCSSGTLISYFQTNNFHRPPSPRVIPLSFVLLL